MSRDDQMKLLKEMSALHGQAEVARRINVSPSSVNQILKGTYGGDPRHILQLVEEEFGTTTADCPVHGEISLKFCAEERRKGFATSRAEIWLACRSCARGVAK